MPCTNYSSGDSPQVALSAGQLAANFCHQNWQATFEAFVAAMAGQLPGGYSSFVIGSATPAAGDQGKLWFRVTDACVPLGWFIYYAGSWKRAQPHGMTPGVIASYYSTALHASDHAINKAIISYLDVYEADYPGQPSTALYSNPFWRLCDGSGGSGTPNLLGRAIVGAGAGAGLTDRLPNATGGAETVTLTTTEIPALPVSAAVGTGAFLARGTDTQIATNIGGGAAHDNMPPFHCLYWIMRTTRLI